MKRLIVILVIALLAFVTGSLATAAVGWRVFAAATDSGEYGTYASANASVQNPKALGIRVKGTGGPFELSWSISCEGVARRTAGGVVIASVANAAKCTLFGYSSGDKSGSVRIELLRR